MEPSPLVARLGYDERLIASFPELVVESFAGGARGEKNARTFEVSGYPFLARKPG
jgi:hypothetical protein